MSFFKKMLLGLLALILINLIGLEIISFNLKSILIDGVIKETIMVQLTSKDYNEPKYKIPEEEINKITDNEQIRELLNSKEVQELLEKYLDQVVNDLTYEENIDDINLEQDMLEFLNNNKSTIEELVGKEITEDMIKDATDQLDTKDLSNSYKQTIINARSNMSDSEKMVLKGYSILISNKLRIIVFILIVLDLLLIALIQKSVYKWIKILGASLLISGIGSIIISFVVKIIVKSLASIDSFNMGNLLNSGIIISIVGILILIIYYLLNKTINKKKESIV